MMSMVLILFGVLGAGIVLWLVLGGKNRREEHDEVDDRYNCQVCDDRDCECHRVEDSENTSQNDSDES